MYIRVVGLYRRRRKPDIVLLLVLKGRIARNANREAISNLVGGLAPEQTPLFGTRGAVVGGRLNLSRKPETAPRVRV